ncbi:MAG: hypothetical protein FP816_01275 [Desulfobacteraceae bacterium]|nr:hypothetical protein [Desulfobacteraceae bacterium]
MDIGITYANGGFDLDLGDGGEAVDNTLKTAVILSLFTDRLADEDDVLPDGGTDRRGWWGDIFPEVGGDLTGSRIWLLSREKQLPSVLRRAGQYAKEALQWLLDDGVILGLDVVAENPMDGVMGLGISIKTLENTAVDMRIATVADAAGYSALVDMGYDMILDTSGGIIFDMSY